MNRNQEYEKTMLNKEKQSNRKSHSASYRKVYRFWNTVSKTNSMMCNFNKGVIHIVRTHEGGGGGVQPMRTSIV